MEMTLLLCSHQHLPCPACLYSTPTKHSSAPVLDTLKPQLSDSYPAFLPALPNLTDPAGNVQGDTVASDMHSFLCTHTPYTVIPPPLPSDKHSELNDLYYTDSPTCDLIAVHCHSSTFTIR
jgi:DNA-directed RNA polymerase